VWACRDRGAIDVKVDTKWYHRNFLRWRRNSWWRTGPLSVTTVLSAVVVFDPIVSASDLRLAC
jgi:hypothetical protein